MKNKMNKGMGCISTKTYKSKKGEVVYYTYRYCVNGKYHSVTAKSMKELRVKYQERISNGTSIVNNSERISEDTSQTYKEWATVWFNTFKAPKLDAKGQYYPGRKPSTQKQNWTYLERKIFPFLGNKQLERITFKDVSKCLESIGEKSNTRHKVFMIINASLQKAFELGYVTRNVAQGIDKPVCDSEKGRAYEPSEQKIMLAELEDDFSKIFFFLCATGMRPGEFYALKKDDFDFQDQKISIVKTSNLHNRSLVGTPKTRDSTRKIDFDKSLFNVFDLSLLGKYSYKQIKSRFKNVIERNHFERISPLHSARHTYASMLNAYGVNTNIIRKELGHSTVEITIGVYTHILQNIKTELDIYFEEYSRYLKAIYK